MLKVLMLRARLKPLNEELETLTRAAEGFQTREAELAADIDAAQTDDERSVVENAVAAFDAEVSENESRSAELRTQIEAIEAEIRTAENSAESARRTATPPADHEREVNTMVFNTRAKMFGATAEAQQAFVAREDVKEFLQRFRGFREQKRSISGIELGIPTVFMDILRPEILRQSKLLGRIYCKPLAGKARQNVAGAVPEAVWTEAIGALNEMDIVFTQLEMDGYKAGGYIAIPNSDLEDDNDLELAVTIYESLSASMALAIDKAAVYGTGAKMPVGFVTRLAAATQPAWWGPNQGEFTDLHNSHVLKLNIATVDTVSGFFRPLLAALGKADPKYSDGKLTWIMNRATHMDILTHALGVDASAAILAGMNNTMPIIGGDIVELEFMSDKDIAGGYLSLERWAERSGATVASSDIPLFIQDQTVFKITARYDGKPARGEGFVICNYGNVDPALSVPFGTDYANTNLNTLIVTAAAGTKAGDTVLTVTGAMSDAPALKYLAKSTEKGIKAGDTVGADWADLTSGTTAITAAAGTPITVVEIDKENKVISVGSVVSVPKTT